MKNGKSKLMSFLKTQNETLICLILGILIFGLIVLLLGIVLVPERLNFLVGVIMGSSCSIARAIHMTKTLQYQLEYTEKGAVGYAARNYLIRYMMMIAMLLVSVKIGMWSAIGTLVGFLLMKPSALLFPQIYKYIYIRIFRD